MRVRSGTAWAGLDQHRRSPDGGGQERTSRNPGCPTDERRAGLAGGTAFPTLQGLKTSDAERLPEARRDVSMLVISWCLEHHDLSFVHSGSADRFRSACYGRPASHRLGTCQLCARSKRRSGSPSVTRRVAESLKVRVRSGSRKAPLSRDQGFVLWSSLHAHKSQDKGV